MNDELEDALRDARAEAQARIDETQARGEPDPIDRDNAERAELLVRAANEIAALRSAFTAMIELVEWTDLRVREFPEVRDA